MLSSSMAAGSPVRTGTITGVVTDDRSGSPVSDAEVLVAGTGLATRTDDRGRFFLEVPVGIYTVKVRKMGYRIAVEMGIAVEGGGESPVDIALEPSVVGRSVEIVVEGSADAEGGSGAYLSPDIIERGTGEGEHRRRGDIGQIAGLSTDDPLMGKYTHGVPLAADSSARLPGGMDAEYGNAQPAVVRIGTRDGGRVFSGQFRYLTDNFRVNEKTYTNYDRVSLNVSGPLLSEQFRYHIAGEVSLTDGEYPSVARRSERELLGDWLSIGRRPYEDFDLQGTISWEGRPGLRLSGEVIYSYSTADRYFHNWNTEGYVQKIYRFLSLGPSRESSEQQARSFGYYVSVYHGSWVNSVPPRLEFYPQAEEERLTCIYPVKIYAKVRDPDNPEMPPFIVEYGHFFARILTDTGGNEVEVIWDEQVIDRSGQVDRYESKLLFEGFQYPESRFSHFRDDSSYVYYNSAEHTLTTTSEDLSVKVQLSHDVGEDLSYTVRLGRLRFDNVTGVDGKDPDEYETAGLPVILPGGGFRHSGVSSIAYYTDPRYPYTVTCYDYPYYGNRVSTAYVLDADLTSTHLSHHRIATGVQVIYSEREGDERYYPGSLRYLEDGSYLQGHSVNRYSNFSTEGAFYVQDRWSRIGISSNVGLRIDFFRTEDHSVINTEGWDMSPYGEGFHIRLSPRAGFSLPVTERDVLHLHYGRFTTWPMGDYLFGMQQWGTCPFFVGDSDLEAECTTAYEAGISHRFTETVSGNVTVFAKDISDRVTTATVLDEGSGTEGCTFVNGPAGGTRGIEIGLRSRLSEAIGGEVWYVYSVSNRELSPYEVYVVPLDWDQRHSVNAVLRLQGASSWQATFVYRFGSGLPWTPVDRFARRQDPRAENSRRLESTHVIDLHVRKNFRFSGLEFALFFEGLNILDEDMLLPGGTAPGVWPPMNSAIMDGGTYLTETGKYGGAYLQDIDGDGVDDFVAVNDPAIWALHRRLRIGFGLGF